MWEFISPGRINNEQLKEITGKFNLSDDITKKLEEDLNVADFSSEHQINKKLLKISENIQNENIQNEINNLSNDIFNNKKKLVEGGDYLQLKDVLGEVNFNKLFNTLINNCDDNGLSNQAVLYTPQYASEDQPLEVLITNAGRSLAEGQSASLQIVGGFKPYTIKNPEKKIEAELKSAEVLLIQRKKPSTGTDGTTTIYVVDARGVREEVEILLPK